MSTKMLALTSLLFALFLSLSACDGGGPPLPRSEALSCAPNTFRVTGTIDQMSIDVTQPSSTGGFAQGGGGDFGSVDNGGSEDATLTDLRLTWKDDLPTGDSGDAAGTLKVPKSPFPEDTFCAGGGTAVRIVPDAEGGGLQFRLAGLASGAACATPRAGTLEGCWR